jgi:hypothetical protein
MFLGEAGLSTGGASVASGLVNADNANGLINADNALNINDYYPQHGLGIVLQDHHHCPAEDPGGAPRDLERDFREPGGVVRDLGEVVRDHGDEGTEEHQQKFVPTTFFSLKRRFDLLHDCSEI